MEKTLLTFVFLDLNIKYRFWVFFNVDISSRKDYLRFLPSGLAEPFTSRQLSEASGFSLRLARRVTYVLRKMGALRVVGKEGQAWRYAVSV